jgi:hypothetical protein
VLDYFQTSFSHNLDRQVENLFIVNRILDYVIDVAIVLILLEIQLIVHTLAILFMN